MAEIKKGEPPARKEPLDVGWISSATAACVEFGKNGKSSHSRQVGPGDGAGVGDGEIVDGPKVGLVDGGLVLGEEVGEDVGRVVGTSERRPVGSEVMLGRGLGTSDGSPVGASLGNCDGSSVGP